MKPSLKLGIAQWNVLEGSPEHNVNRLNDLAKEARSQGLDLMLIPEMWYCGYDYKNFTTHATDFNGGAFSALSRAAKINEIAICGSSVRKKADHFYNSMTLFDSSGELISSYDKLYLFAPMGEADHFSPGDRVVVADWEGWKIGFGICYDLRFPELFRNQLKEEMQLILLSAQWPVTRIAHWDLLVQARAVENQAFMAACNRVGKNEKYTFPGHSAVIDPRGNILLRADDQGGLWQATIDQNDLFDYRKKLHFLYDIRNDVY